MTVPYPPRPATLRYPAPTLYLRQPDGKVGKATVYQRLSYIERFNDIGTWTAVLPYNEDTLWAAEPNWGVLAQELGFTTLSGQISKPKVIEPSGNTPGRIELEGVDDMDVLARNLAWPAPANPLTNQNAAYDKRTGVASTLIWLYQDANLGWSARPERQQPHVAILADPAIGATVTEQARFDNLLSICQSIARKGGIGFSARAAMDGIIQLGCYQPRNKTALRFSTAIGNAVNVEWSREGGVSDLIGGGQGDLDLRTFVRATNTQTRADYGYREGFYDYRNADPTQLQADTNAKLLEEGPTRQASFVPLDTDQIRFGRDYALGDTVTFETLTATGVQSWTVAIREVEREWTRGGGRKVTPRAGDVGATATTKQRLSERELIRRVERLERGA